MAESTTKATPKKATTKPAAASAKPVAEKATSKASVASAKPAAKKTAAKTAAPKPEAKAAAKPAVKKTPAAAKPAAEKKPAAKTRGKAMIVTDEQRYRMVAEAAYYRAESNQFKSDPLRDWIEAENDIAVLLSGGK